MTVLWLNLETPKTQVGEQRAVLLLIEICEAVPVCLLFLFTKACSMILVIFGYTQNFDLEFELSVLISAWKFLTQICCVSHRVQVNLNVYVWCEHVARVSHFAHDVFKKWFIRFSMGSLLKVQFQKHFIFCLLVRVSIFSQMGYYSIFSSFTWKKLISFYDVVYVQKRVIILAFVLTS